MSDERFFFEKFLIHRSKFIVLLSRLAKAGCLLLPRGEHEILAPNQVFFERVKRGRENVRTSGTAASQGLGNLAGVVAYSHVTFPLTFYLKRSSLT